MTAVPETKYAKSGDLHIAYQTIGTGSFDLVFMHGWISHIEHMWEEPRIARFLDRLASFARLIVLDKRGTGLSDPVPLDRLATTGDRERRQRVRPDGSGPGTVSLLDCQAGTVPARDQPSRRLRRRRRAARLDQARRLCGGGGGDGGAVRSRILENEPRDHIVTRTLPGQPSPTNVSHAGCLSMNSGPVSWSGKVASSL